MMPAGDWILLCLAAVLAVPWAVLAIEAIASLFPAAHVARSSERPPCAVIVPAHNEEAGILATVLNIREQLVAGDRLIVVADNCMDRTAAVAREGGAEVVERTNAAQRGKGYALAFGLEHVSAQPPVVAVFVDGDCEFAAGGLEAIVRQATATGRPAQAIYRIGTGREADARRRLSAFAVVLKNEIRPRGLHRLGLPCLLTGAGMAFPWHVIRNAPLASGNIVEDAQLGIDLALAGHPPRLCPTARITGAAAPDRASALKQRTRWEHGHIGTIVSQCPRLFTRGIGRFRFGLVGLGLELGVPPLSLLGMVTIMALVGLAIWGLLGGSWLPGAVLGAAVGWALVGVFLAWVRFGRDVLPLWALATMPAYVLWKVPLYVKAIFSREKAWSRTAREGPSRPAPE